MLGFSGTCGRFARGAVLPAAAVVLIAGPAVGGDLEAQVERLIETYRQVSAKPGDIAAKLQAAAEGLAKDAPLRRAMHEAAYEYGMKGPAGHATAIAAATSLADLDEGRKPDGYEKLVKVESLRHRLARGKGKQAAASDYVDALLRLAGLYESLGRLTEARERFLATYRLARSHRLAVARLILLRVAALDARQRADRLAGQWQRLLEKNPRDARAAAAMVDLQLREMDDPAAAGKHLHGDAPEVYRTYLPLACRPPAELNEQQCNELARWYADLAKKASSFGKPRLLGRAAGYLERFLQLHAEQDVPRLTAQDLLNQVETELNNYPWLGIKGVLVGTADDQFSLFRNGRKLAHSQGLCKPSKPVSVRLMPGDLLCAKLYNWIYGCAFSVSLKAGGKEHRITSWRWRSYKPADPKQWWQVIPSASDELCKDLGKGSIWGQGKGSDTWVYRVLTEQDFAPFVAEASRK
jgi:hypothetical protein